MLLRLIMNQNLAGTYLTTLITFDNFNMVDSLVSLADCAFEDNKSFSNGGIMFLSASKISIKNSNYTNNLSYQSGGAFFIDKVNELEIKDCVFKNNTSLYSGGAVFVNYISAISPFNVTNTIFLNNTSI